MTNETILDKITDKAIKGGFTSKSLNDADFYYGFIFRHDFAKALGFRLQDLGAWCDEGKEPLLYLEKFL